MGRLSTYNIKPSGHAHAAVEGDGNVRRMRQDELDLVQFLAATDQLDGGFPAVTGVAEAVEENDGRGVPGDGGEHQWCGAAQRRSHGYVYGYGNAIGRNDEMQRLVFLGFSAIGLQST
jgi:hypothetical protein